MFLRESAIIGFLVIVLLVLLVNIEVFTNVLFGISPSFSRQEIQDSNNDWIYSENSSYAKISNISIPNIETVSYSSNGYYLNATLWLSIPFEENPLEYVHYLMYIDIDGNNMTGLTGADYAVGIRWDNNTKQWNSEFLEFSKL